MNTHALTELVEHRWRLLHQLLGLGDRQAEAVRHGRMSELLSILSEKQPALETLKEVSQQLRESTAGDPERRDWSSPEERSACRERHAECERMLETLLRQEADSEAALLAGRESLEERLQRSEGGRRAVSGYAGTSLPATAGGQIDLSSR